jgi:hypothetical protein
LEAGSRAKNQASPLLLSYKTRSVMDDVIGFRDIGSLPGVGIRGHRQTSCGDLVLFVGPAHDDLEHIIRQRSLKCFRFVP